MSKQKPANNSSQPSSLPQSVVLEKLRFLGGYPTTRALVAIVLLLLVVYSPSLTAPTFIQHDDSVLRLPLLSRPGNVPDIFSRDFLLFTEGQYRPLSYTFLSVIRLLADMNNTLFWHLFLVGFHGIDTLLVFALVRRFTPRFSVALFSAAAFGVHPLGTILANDINQFYLILGLTMSLSSMVTYLTFAGRGRRFFYALALIGYGLGLITDRLTLSVGLILLVYELAYARSGWKRIVLRLLPFVAMPLLFSPWLFMTTPHPLHFKYVQTHEGSLFHGFFSVTGATGLFADGLFPATQLPVVLHETVENIFSPANPKFLFWFVVNVAVFATALWAAFKKQWAAFGCLIVYLSAVPYASVAFNRVVDYVSWTYFYFPLVGIAFFLGGVYDLAGRVRWRSVAVGARIVLVAMLLFWGGRTVQLNRYAASSETYWNHVWELKKNGQTALYELGKTYLAQNNLPLALHHFFNPFIKDLKPACLVMARYYCERGEFLASAVHLRFGSGKENTGVVLEGQCGVAADLLVAAGAPDHAEENLGKILMVDPFNTAAMSRLAQVWYLKGFVSEGKRMLERVRAISPHDENARRIDEQFKELDQAWENGQPVTVEPPPPDWLDYVLTQNRSPELRREIVELSDRADLNDAVIQLEAVISHLENGENESASRRASLVTKCLTRYAFACSVACEALALGGNPDEAIQAGHHAISLDSKSQLAWRSLTIAYAQKGEFNEAAKNFIKTIERNPGLASMFYYNLGLQKSKKGLNQEAIEWLKKAVQARSDHVEAQQALGNLLLNYGPSGDAIETLRAALKIKPDDAETHAQLGRGLLAAKNYKEGIESFRKAITIDPENPAYHYYLGQAYSEINNYKEAVNEFKRTVELTPDNVGARFKLGNVYFNSKQYDEAIDCYKQVIESDPRFMHSHMNLGTIYQLQKRYDDAIKEYWEEIRNYPKFTEAYNRIILIHWQKGEFDTARKVANEAKQLGIELSPTVLQAIQ